MFAAPVKRCSTRLTDGERVFPNPFLQVKSLKDSIFQDSRVQLFHSRLIDYHDAKRRTKEHKRGKGTPERIPIYARGASGSAGKGSPAETGRNEGQIRFAYTNSVRARGTDTRSASQSERSVGEPEQGNTSREDSASVACLEHSAFGADRAFA